MITEQQLEFVRDSGSKFGRFLMGFLFFASGLSMLFVLGPDGTAAFLSSLGVPAALLMAWLVIALKVIAGGALIIGRYVPEAAAALIIFTLISTLLAHMSPDVDPTFPNSLLKNLAIVGGLLYVMAFGPGGTNLKARSNSTEPAETAA